MNKPNPVNWAINAILNFWAEENLNSFRTVTVVSQIKAICQMLAIRLYDKACKNADCNIACTVIIFYSGQVIAVFRQVPGRLVHVNPAPALPTVYENPRIRNLPFYLLVVAGFFPCSH